MINKEFIVGSGGIIKDFQDRNIPQNANNFVSVGVLIPVSEFANLGTYGVCLATSKIVGGVETNLPSLICYSAKTLKIEGVDYIKYQCQLSISYTNFIGQLKLTPYIIEIETLNEGEEDEEVVITTQKTFTNTTLNVIRSVASTSDASLEDAEAIDTLTALIQAKNIKLIDDYKTGTKAQAIVGCFENYNASFFDAWLLIVKYSGGSFALLPYKNGANNEFTEVDLDGTYYKLSDYSSGTYTSTKLTYTKGDIDTILTNYYLKTETYSNDEVDALLNTKVDKTFTISGKALSGSGIQLEKGDVGLDNVENYGIVNSPSADATNKYVDAGGLYTYLITNYADKSDYDTTKQKVNTMWAMFQDDGNDVVDTLYDLLKVFENFPETETIAPILSGIESRLDTLESMGNVVANVGNATLLTSDWASNSDSYSTDYPYKTTYQNDLLKGATNFSVIFSVDAVSMGLCPTAILDNTTGTITFYAEEIPSVDLDIENIVAFTTLNAINTLTTDTINQVNQNKNDIADINNVKLPLYELKQESLGSGNGTKTLAITNGTYILQAKYGSGATLKQARFRLNKDYAQMDYQSGESSQYNAYIKLLKETNDDRAYIEMQTKDHTLKLDSNGLTLDNKSLNTNRLFTSSTDATESSGTYTLALTYLSDTPNVDDYVVYVDNGSLSTLYQVSAVGETNATLNKIGDIGGGGKQLYQHNIHCRIYTNYYFQIQITNDSATQFTINSLIDWLWNNGFKGVNNGVYNAVGVSNNNNVIKIYSGVYNDTRGRLILFGMLTDGTISNDSIAKNETPDIFNDIVIPL